MFYHKAALGRLCCVCMARVLHLGFGTGPLLFSSLRKFPSKGAHEIMEVDSLVRELKRMGPKKAGAALSALDRTF